MVSMTVRQSPPSELMPCSITMAGPVPSSKCAWSLRLLRSVLTCSAPLRRVRSSLEPAVRMSILESRRRHTGGGPDDRATIQRTQEHGLRDLHRPALDPVDLQPGAGVSRQGPEPGLGAQRHERRPQRRVHDRLHLPLRDRFVAQGLLRPTVRLGRPPGQHPHRAVQDPESLSALPRLPAHEGGRREGHRPGAAEGAGGQRAADVA